jgi:hypothetical protein
MCRIDGAGESFPHVLTNQKGETVCEMTSRWEERKGRPDIAEVLDRKL